MIKFKKKIKSFCKHSHKCNFCIIPNELLKLTEKNRSLFFLNCVLNWWRCWNVIDVGYDVDCDII